LIIHPVLLKKYEAGSVARDQRVQRGGAAHFVILSGEKRRMLENG